MGHEALQEGGLTRFLTAPLGQPLVEDPLKLGEPLACEHWLLMA